jgi:hypothetical protein
MLNNWLVIHIKEIKYLRETLDNWSRELYEMAFKHKDNIYYNCMSAFFKASMQSYALWALLSKIKQLSYNNFFITFIKYLVYIL